MAFQKSRVQNFLLVLGAGVFTLVLMYALSSRQRYTGAFQYVCRQVYLKHYMGSEHLTEWYQKCMADKARVQSTMSSEKVADILRQRFSELESSHLEIYSPQEDKLVWTGQAGGDNGIRTRGIDGRIVISRVIEKSSAEKVGVKVGDVIISVYGEKAYGAYPYNEINGEMTVLREGKELVFKVQAGELQVDFSPRLRSLESDVGLLEISSFRKEYFDSNFWDNLEDSLQDYPSLIVDLRGNLGGDFNAVMKTLSFFMCENSDFGYLDRPAADSKLPTLVFAENSTEDEFYDQLTSSKRLLLRRFKSPCYNGAITVLVDGDTASVSEIFAAILKERAQTRVWGERTRGDMLLGVWYPLAALGQGYTLSIPEALYVGPKNEIIEGKGVEPSRKLFYKLTDATKGKDSWVQASLAPY